MSDETKLEAIRAEYKTLLNEQQFGHNQAIVARDRTIETQDRALTVERERVRVLREALIKIETTACVGIETATTDKGRLQILRGEARDALAQIQGKEDEKRYEYESREASDATPAASNYGPVVSSDGGRAPFDDFKVILQYGGNPSKGMLSLNDYEVRTLWEAIEHLIDSRIGGGK